MRWYPSIAGAEMRYLVIRDGLHCPEQGDGQSQALIFGYYETLSPWYFHERIKAIGNEDQS